MKANEIQIGDWLYSIIDRYDHIEKKICKVVGIRTDCDTSLIQCDDTDVWYSLESYEPIPLIPEILEKNGFKLDKEDGWWWLTPKIGITFWEEGDIELEFENKHSSVDIHIKHLHQLQHALRLCGIEKEIEL